jgi:hypothetical protein
VLCEVGEGGGAGYREGGVKEGRNHEKRYLHVTTSISGSTQTTLARQTFLLLSKHRYSHTLIETRQSHTLIPTTTHVTIHRQPQNKDRRSHTILSRAMSDPQTHSDSESESTTLVQPTRLQHTNRRRDRSPLINEADVGIFNSIPTPSDLITVLLHQLVPPVAPVDVRKYEAAKERLCNAGRVVAMFGLTALGLWLRWRGGKALDIFRLIVFGAWLREWRRRNN